MTDRKQALIDLLEKVEAGGIEHYHWSILGTAMPERTWSATKSAYHGSLDAAKALHEAVLPEFWHYDIDSEACAVCVFQLGVNNAQIGEHNNPSRAWLIAILKALIEMENDND